MKPIFSFLSLMAFILTGLSPMVGLADTTTIKVDGSSTVFPITEAVAEEFQNSTRGQVKVTVGISGTGGGFKKFCRGETDIQDASRPISKEEMENCRKAGIQYFELPVAYDAITIAVSPKNQFLKDITVEDLKKIWAPEAQNKITTWKQVRSEWPDKPLKLYGAGADSGTFDYFTEAVVGKSKSSRGDYTASEDDNTIVQGIANDESALGYLPYSYYDENKKKLKALSVKGIHPSRQTVESGTYSPLSRPIFIYVNKKSSEKAEVRDFVEFYMKHGSKLSAEVKYVPLPAKAYTLALDKFKKGHAGTAFGGHNEVGLKVEDLLKREMKH